MLGQTGNKAAAAELNAGAQRALVGATDTHDGQSLARPQHGHLTDWRRRRRCRSLCRVPSRCALTSTQRCHHAFASAGKLLRMLLQALQCRRTSRLNARAMRHEIRSAGGANRLELPVIRLLGGSWRCGCRRRRCRVFHGGRRRRWRRWRRRSGVNTGGGQRLHRMQTCRRQSAVLAFRQSASPDSSAQSKNNAPASHAGCRLAERL